MKIGTKTDRKLKWSGVKNMRNKQRKKNERREGKRACKEGKQCRKMGGRKER
jgi:hypothetical protein